MNYGHTLFVSLIVVSVLDSCVRSGQDQPPPDNISLEQPLPASHAQDTLTREQLNDIKNIHNTFAEVMSASLEETIISFKSDQQRNKKLALWLKMARAYERFSLKVHFEDHDKKDEAFQLLLMRSTMTKEEVVSKRRIHYLSAREVEELFTYYSDPAADK